mmetsp:Transcript_17077/g.35699  ORF Transcript_17077/g.35699 Transcript_17077/m.35699 type:complete len:295 (-) Transcript_17077:93-977(-)
MFGRLINTGLPRGRLVGSAAAVGAFGTHRVIARSLTEKTTTKVAADAAPPAQNAVIAWCASNPMTFGIGFATVKTQAADLFTQMNLEKKPLDKVDWRRNVLFATFGFAYMGCFQYYLYVTLFSRWFAGASRFANQSIAKKLRDRTGQVDLMKQVGFDVLIHPIWFFPVYYTMKESLNGKPNVFEAPFPTVAGNAIKKYWNNNFVAGSVMADWLAFWKIWIVGDMVVYGLMPMWARLPANHFFSFLYVVVLSFTRGGEEPPKLEDAEGALKALPGLPDGVVAKVTEAAIDKELRK